MLLFLLVLLLVIALLCTWLRHKALRWLFTALAVVFWIAFLGLCGFALGYQAAAHGVRVSRLLF